MEDDLESASRPKAPDLRFRFKSKSADTHDPTTSKPRSGRERSHRHRRHHHAKHRRRKQPSPAPPLDPPLSPNTAFRESLFDALADDEGAAYWEGVYGQPVHVYKDKLDLMGDEEYAKWVRGRMWEKAHPRAPPSQESSAKEAKGFDEGDEYDEESRGWGWNGDQKKRAAAEDSRREERAKRRAERRLKRYEDYEMAWKLLLQASTSTKLEDSRPLTARIPWPTAVGTLVSVLSSEGSESMEEFFRQFSAAAADSRGKEDLLRGMLKRERIRWHPDRMRRALAPEKLEGDTEKAVNEVFLVVDRLWGESAT